MVLQHGCAYHHVVTVLKSVGLAGIDNRNIVFLHLILYLFFWPTLVSIAYAICPFLVALERLEVLCYSNLM